MFGPSHTLPGNGVTRYQVACVRALTSGEIQYGRSQLAVLLAQAAGHGKHRNTLNTTATGCVYANFKNCCLSFFLSCY